ncbi:MAG: helix-turn-helix transcriptional regulator [Slackia sp.]|nr:helix-turn-helix transcriptional regulator [Slackia sp.]
MLEPRSVSLEPTHARFATGYACTCAWAIVLLFSPAFGSPTQSAAAVSMLPGLIACLGSIALFRFIPPLAGRTPFVAFAATFMAAGTFLYTHPALSDIAALRMGALALSGFFAIIVVMAWFEMFAKLPPRTIVILAGFAVSIAAGACWLILACPPEQASVLATALPLASCILLPKSSRDRQAARGNGRSRTDARATMLQVIQAAVPLRTLAGLAITFFIVRSIATLAPEYELFSAAVSPLSLFAPIGITAFFAGSAFVVKRIDPSILYKILLSCFAGCVFLLAFSTGVTAALVFYANIVAEVMMWTVLVLWAKKTPVKPHLVFAIGWIAECVGNMSGQIVMPLFADKEPMFFALAIMLILIGVGFAFSEGQLVLNVDFEDEDRPALKAEIGSKENHVRNALEIDGESTSSNDSSPANASDAAARILQNSGQRPARIDKDGEEMSGEPGTEPDAGRFAPDPLDAFVEKYGISPRERDVLAFWLAGRGMKYIENELFISESTVKSHLRSIYRKCDTHNRDETISLFELIKDETTD